MYEPHKHSAQVLGEALSLVPDLERLTKALGEQLREQLGDLPASEQVSVQVQLVAHSDSTNADLRAQPAGSPGVVRVLITDDQRAGRGRLDRRWITPPATALAVSVAWDAAGVGMPQWTWLSLASALSLCEALAGDQGLRHAGVRPVVKWPNDVLLVSATGSEADTSTRAEHKVAGILAEIGGQSPPVCIVGVGINLYQSQEQLPIPQATSLALSGWQGEPTQLIAAYLAGLLRRWLQWAQAHGDAVRCGLHTEYLQQCVTVGREVHVTLPGGDQIVGVATGIELDGCLRIRPEPTADGESTETTVGVGDVIHAKLGE